MRLFWEVTRRALRRTLSYRAATMAGLITNLGFGLLRIAVLLALYGEREAVGNLTVSGAITYAALTQATIAYLNLFGWYDLMNSVHTGEIATDFLKPMRFFTFWLAQDAGRALVAITLRGVLLLLLYELMLDLDYPGTAVQWLLLALAVLLSWLLSFAYRFLINLAAFWSPQARGMIGFAYVIVWFGSGFLMPLNLFPNWVQQALAWTPFPYMIHVVAEIFLGLQTGPQAWLTLAIQAGWAVLFMGLGQLVLKRGVRRLVILGG